MTYLSHTGEFTTVTGGEIDATTFFDPVYGATGLTLEVISTVPSVPQVCIASPADGLVVNSGTSVTFQGIASDPEDGDLSASIVWTSNIQAGEFSGAGFTTGGLADGVHTITATVTDSNSNTSTDSITVTVSDTLPVLSIDGPEMVRPTARSLTLAPSSPSRGRPPMPRTATSARTSSGHRTCRWAQLRALASPQIC